MNKILNSIIAIVSLIILIILILVILILILNTNNTNNTSLSDDNLNDSPKEYWLSENSNGTAYILNYEQAQAGRGTSCAQAEKLTNSPYYFIDQQGNKVSSKKNIECKYDKTVQGSDNMSGLTFTIDGNKNLCPYPDTEDNRAVYNPADSGNIQDPRIVQAGSISCVQNHNSAPTNGLITLTYWTGGSTRQTCKIHADDIYNLPNHCADASRTLSQHCVGLTSGVYSCKVNKVSYGCNISAVVAPAGYIVTVYGKPQWTLICPPWDNQQENMCTDYSSASFGGNAVAVLNGGEKWGDDTAVGYTTDVVCCGIKVQKISTPACFGGNRCSSLLNSTLCNEFNDTEGQICRWIS